eukprot:COSAG06_NODE_29252_length_560_cov_0.459870_2_plen_55_part_01
MAQQSTAGEITAFLDQLVGQAEITDFIQNLGFFNVTATTEIATEFNNLPLNHALA